MPSDQLPLPLDRGLRPAPEPPKPQGAGTRRLAAAGVLLGGVKVLPFLKTLLTMGLSVCAYAVGNGWAFAALFVLLLFCHELGHVWAAKRLGLPVSVPIFIPFFGALITMKRNPRAAAHEAYLAVGGPLTGSLAALATLTVGWAVGSEVLVHAAIIGFFLNLFNLAPLSPLDGGRMVAAVSPWLWLLGAAIMAPLLIFLHAWFFGALLCLMAWPNLKRLFVGRDRAWRAYHTCTRRQRLYASGAWLFLAVLLFGLMFAAAVGLPFWPRVAVLAAAWAGLPLLTWACIYTWPLGALAVSEAEGYGRGPLV